MGVTKAVVGRYIPNPKPLHCPNFPVWAARTGQTYLVFIDETYRQFFELSERGYFCYGAVGIPEQDYEAVKTAFGPVLDKYRQLLVAVMASRVRDRPPGATALTLQYTLNRRSFIACSHA